MKKLWVVGLLLLIMVPPIKAENYGVRPSGMGGAFTAVANDENAIFYNLAGLSGQRLVYSWQNFDYSGFNYQQSNSHLLQLGSLGYASGGKNTASGDFSNFNILGFGRADWGGIKWGLGYRRLEEKIGSGAVQTGGAFDLGILAPLTPQIRLGLGTENLLVSNSNFSSAYRLGVAFFPTASKDLILAADGRYQKSASRTTTFHYGLEFKLAEGLRIRGGWNDGTATFGVSGDVLFLTLDYAQEYVSGGPCQKFGVSFRIFDERRQRRPALFFKEKEVLVLNIGGPVIGGFSEWSFLGGWKNGADEILGILRKAGEDPYLEAVVLHIYDFSSGVGGEALVQELRREISRIRGKGKLVVAYLEGNAGGREYYLASAADKVVAPALGFSGGFGSVLTIYKIYELGQKFGINWQVLSSGKYKAETSPYSQAMSEEARLQLTNLVKDVQNTEFAEIATSRNLKISQLEKLLDGRLITVEAAREMGLIDEIGYFDEALILSGKLLGLKDKNKPKVITPAQLIVEEPGLFVLPLPNKVAVIGINGEIQSGTNSQNIIFGGSFTGSDSVCEQIQKAIEDKSIKAILLRINSGGGGDLAAAQIYAALKKARESGKVVYASLGDVAASGAYYIASASDKIMAAPSTITGHIGVIGVYAELKKIFEKLGITTETVKTAKYIDMFSGTRPFTEEEKQMIQSFLDRAYNDFISSVASGRKMPREKVALLAEGQLFTGSQAQKVGLVDTLGNFYDAVDQTKKIAQISGEPELVYYNSNFDLFVPFDLSRMGSRFDKLELVNYLGALLGGKKIK